MDPPDAYVVTCAHRRLKGYVKAEVISLHGTERRVDRGLFEVIKRQACGFRNLERFRNAIYSHLGDLDLYPTARSATHTTS